MKRDCKFLFLFLLLLQLSFSLSAEVLHFVYVSDTHYGLYREFREYDDATSREVNRAMIESINLLPDSVLPSDGGVGADESIEYIEAVLNTGDITNRMERGVLSAKKSWQQFDSDWSSRLTIKSRAGVTSPQYLSAGNHEASNAKGLYKLTKPTDATPMVELYNRMPTDKDEITTETFDFSRDRIHYSVVMGGVRFLFVALWCDSVEREWVAEELRGSDEPVLLFSHDAPMVEVKHLRSPDSEEESRFEEILSDVSSVATTKEFPAKEVDELAAFLRSQPRIKGYFHGDDNYNEFYDFKDTRGESVIPVFRVDSPMKGRQSKKDESKLSYILISLDSETMQLTAREVLWNLAIGEVLWGDRRTINLF